MPSSAVIGQKLYQLSTYMKLFLKSGYKIGCVYERTEWLCKLEHKMCNFDISAAVNTSQWSTLRSDEVREVMS